MTFGCGRLLLFAKFQLRHLHFDCLQRVLFVCYAFVVNMSPSYHTLYINTVYYTVHVYRASFQMLVVKYSAVSSCDYKFDTQILMSGHFKGNTGDCLKMQR